MINNNPPIDETISAVAPAIWAKLKSSNCPIYIILFFLF